MLKYIFRKSLTIKKGCSIVIVRRHTNKRGNNMSVINGVEVVLTKEGEGDWVASLTNVLGDEIVGYGETEHQAIEDLRTAIYHRGE
jgi:hypothetical protein